MTEDDLKHVKEILALQGVSTRAIVETLDKLNEAVADLTVVVADLQLRLAKLEHPRRR